MTRVDNDLNAIKGGGAAQLREKVLAEAAKTWVIVADYRKNSQVLGTNVSGLAVTNWSLLTFAFRPRTALIFRFHPLSHCRPFTPFEHVYRSITSTNGVPFSPH
jgi:hypothetical protein